VAENAHRRKLPARALPAGSQARFPKDPHAAIYNAKLAALVNKVEKAQLQAAANDEAFVPPVKPRRTKVEAAVPKLLTPADVHAAWLLENPQLGKNGARRYKQVVSHLNAYRADWSIITLTRKEYLDYMAHVAALGLVDSTIKHVKFLRECFRLAGLAVPSWLKVGALRSFAGAARRRAAQAHQPAALRAGGPGPGARHVFAASPAHATRLGPVPASPAPHHHPRPAWCRSYAGAQHPVGKDRGPGADMIMLGSGGDTNLKEKALGHADVYGHDALERYGPALLKAWKTVLGATELNAPKPLPGKPRNKPRLTGGGTLFRVVKRE